LQTKNSLAEDMMANCW